MRTNNAYGGAVFAEEVAENLRADAHGSLRHSRAHTRAQRARWIAKRTAARPWLNGPGGLYAKWTGSPSVRRSMAHRIFNANRHPKLKRPRYPLNEDVA